MLFSCLSSVNITSGNIMKKRAEKKIQIQDQKTGYKLRYLVKDMILPSGQEERFFISDDSDSVQILAITKETPHKIILVKQFRAGNEQEWTELPGGGLEKGETELEKAAARELLEETGYEGSVHYLMSIPYNPYSSGLRHCFVAWDCERVSKSLDLDPNEFLTPMLASIPAFLKLVEKGAVRGGGDLLYPSAKKLEQEYGFHGLLG